MILEGKILPAFEKFYAEDVVMQDNDYPQRVGKDMNRQYEEAFVNILINDGIASVEWWFDYTHKDYRVRNYTKLCVQRWKNGQIVEEKFYYNN